MALPPLYFPVNDDDQRRLAKAWYDHYRAKPVFSLGGFTCPLGLWVPSSVGLRILLVTQQKRETKRIREPIGPQRSIVEVMVDMIPAIAVRETKKGLVVTGEEIEPGAFLFETFERWSRLTDPAAGATDIPVESVDDFLGDLR